MERWGIGFVCLAATLAATDLGAADDPLARFRWTSRVLVVSAPRSDDAAARAQIAIAAEARTAMADRDLVTVEAFGEGPEASALRRRLRLPQDRFRAVLVGKDGEAKMTASTPITAERLAATIDAMPMRRDEIRR